MDNGEVIPGLNQDWTLGGAKLSEWIGGFMMFIISSELFFHNIGRSMPWLMLIWVTTTFGLAGLRRSFPDEEKGLRNAIMTAAGFAPPGTPTPAALQPYWSGAPMRILPSHSPFVRLGLEDVIGKGDNKIADNLDQNLMK
jgi:hypothetical protein